MAYAVMGHLDSATEQSVLMLWRKIADQELAVNPEGEGLRPHLTLAVFDQLDVAAAERALASVVGRCLPCALTFSHFGLFLGDKNVVFLGPTVTPHLLSVHRTIHKICGALGTGANALYAPGTLVPHTTLALDLAPAALLETISIIADMSLPVTGTIVEIGVIEFRPVRHLFTVFPGQNH